MTAVILACALALLIGLGLFGAFHQAPTIDAAHADFPTYEDGATVDRWNDPTMDRHIASALAIGHGADAASIAHATARMTPTAADELAARRQVRR